MFNLALSFQN